MIQAIGFGVVAACTLLSALFVVGSKRLVHAVLWLGLMLAATGVLYVMLDATFLAGIQILLYVGGVVTLMIFGVMLTKRGDQADVQDVPARRLRGGIIAGTLFSVVTAAIVYTPLTSPPGAASPTTRELGIALFGPYALAFEVLSVLLLATMIGAIVLARRRDAGAPTRSLFERLEPHAGATASAPAASASEPDAEPAPAAAAAASEEAAQ